MVNQSCYQDGKQRMPKTTINRDYWVK